MEDCRPNTCPGHELGIDGDIVYADDIVDGEVEQGDETRHTNDGQWLGTEHAEDNGCHGGGEQGLVNSKELSRSTIHVESVGDGRKKAIIEDISISSTKGLEFNVCKKVEG